MATAVKESEQLSIEIPDGARRLRVQYVPRALIHPDPAQPRVDADDELRASIAATGILQPITVRPHPALAGNWMIVDGERRWRGAEGVQDEIPILPRRDQEDEYFRLRTQGVANTGKAFTPLEEARMFARALALLGDEGSIERVAQDFGRPRSSVAERIGLLELGPWVPMLERDEVSVSQAVRALLPVRTVPDKYHEIAIANVQKDWRWQNRGRGEMSVADFEKLISQVYRQFMYPLAKTKSTFEKQPEFPTAKHDDECTCGRVKWALGSGDTKRVCCANPDWWKPQHRKALAAKKPARSKQEESAPTVKGGKELYLPAGTPTVNAGYSSTAKGVINLTEAGGRWDVGRDEDAFDPADLVINDAKLVLVTSSYGAPKVGTKDAAAVKAAREKWAARWAAREQELQAEYSLRLREGAAQYAVTGPGVVQLVELLAIVSADDLDGEFVIGDYVASVGLEYPEAIGHAWGEERTKKVRAWVAKQAAEDLEKLAVAIAMSRGGFPLPAAQARQERQAAADAFGKQASPWTKKPKAAKGQKAEPAAKPAATKKATAVKRAPEPVFMREFHPSPALAAVVGDTRMPRTEVTKRLWDYIRKQGLQDTKNRRQINADDTLRPVFGGKKSVSMFEMTKLVNKHLSDDAGNLADGSAPSGSAAATVVPFSDDEDLDGVVDGADDDELWDAEDDEESGDAWDAEDEDDAED